MTHKLLLRQLKRLGLSREALPTSIEEWNGLLDRIGKAYSESDQERYLLERSLLISSSEMQERWQTVRDLEEQWRSLGECAPDLILMVDLDGYVTFANRGRGPFSKEDLIGRKLESFYIAADIRTAMEAFQSVIQSQKLPKLEIRGRGPENEELKLLQRMTPVEKKGLVTSVLVVETDVTEQVRLSQQIDQERARSANAAKLATLGEMAGGIAHEINTPLATIQLLANLLREVQPGQSGDAPTIESVATKIETTVARISKIIRGLRTFARDSGGDPFETVPVSTIVEDSLDLVREKLRLASVELRIVPIPKDFKVECRPTQISQILLNLCSNASDAAPKDIPKWIEIEVRNHLTSIDIVVTDCGLGIPEKIRDKIMHPFFTTKDPGKGTGLGLSISKGIAEQHHGQLYLDEAHKNTRFVLSLPKKQPAQKAS